MIDTLIDAAEDAGVEYSTDYSGRGMFGAECFAIYGRNADLVNFIRQMPDDVGDEFVDPRVDNMGMDYVYYWPHIKTKEGMF